MFLHLLNISLPFHFAYIAVFVLLWKFVIHLFVESASCGWGWNPCQGFLLGGAVSVFWLVELQSLLSECNEVASSEFGGIYGFGMALGSPFFHVRGCVPVS